MLATLGTWLLDAWAGPEGWRRRRESMYSKSKPTYDAYPSTQEAPTVRFYVEARDIKGRLLREYVDLEGYSVHQLNWRSGAVRGGQLVRDWFVGQMLEALVRLTVRLDEVKDQRREFDYPQQMKEMP